MKKRMTWLLIIIAFGFSTPKVMAQDQDAPSSKDSVKQDTIPNRDTETDEPYNPLERFLPPSPQAAALARYGEYPVSLATGVPEISIPLYEIKLGSYSLPISISYHASGIKVDDVASTVGLGWVLNAGGVVTRTVCGAPDLRGTTNNYDYYYRDYNHVQTLYQQAASTGTNISVLEGLTTTSLTNDYDTQSDRYSYNFGQHSGVFRYSHTDEAFYTLNHYPLNIEGVSGTNSFFRIVDTDGIEYIFREQEISGIVNDENMADISSWYLTEICTPYGNITFTYTTSADDIVTYSASQTTRIGSFIFNDVSNLPYAFETNQEADGYRHHVDLTKHIYRQKNLSKITWQGNSVLFTYSSNRSDIGSERLTKIEVKSMNNDILKTINFGNTRNYGNGTFNYRMMLDTVSLSDEGTYTFSYNESGSLPDYNTENNKNKNCVCDFWGYSNGNNTMYHIPADVLQNAYIQSGVTFATEAMVNNMKLYAANRGVNFFYMSHGILTDVTYPTGGKTHYDYSANGLGTQRGGLHVSMISTLSANNDTINKKVYSYVNGRATHEPIENLLTYWSYHNYFDATVDHLATRQYATCTSDPLISLNNCCGSPVFFPTVYESVYHGNTLISKTKYEYSMGRLYDYDGHTSSQIECYSGLTPPGINDEGSYQPLLLGKISYNPENNVVQQTEEYSYEGAEPKTFSFGTKLLSVIKSSYVNGTPYGLSPYLVNSDHILFRELTAHVKTFSLVTKTVTDIQAGVSTTETYTYDPQFRTLQPKTITKTNSDGKVFKTTHKFTFESSQQPYTTMANDYNMVDQIIETRDTCNNTLLRTLKKTFLYQNDWYYPEYLYESLLDNTQVEKLHLSDYDSHGNPRTIIENGTDKTAIVWGFKSNWPVAKVSGLSYTDLIGLGLTNTLNTIAQDSVPSRMTNYLTTLRSGIGSNGLVTTYNYKPLFGPSAITTEYGYTTYYDYGTDSKLSAIRDYNGPLQQFTYQYAHAYNGNTYSTNYVQTTDMLSSSTGKITCQYYDGLGRPVETAKDINGKYVYTRQTYDGKGRVSEDWLSAPGSNTLNELNSIASISSSFYGDNYAYSITTYDALDRPVFIQTPGQDWHNNQKGITKEYLSNAANSVKCYHAVLNNSSIIENGFYAQNTLYAEKTTDEDGRLVAVYTDKLGRKVLERRDTDNDTYYVYDDLGQLRYVMPPEAADYYKSNSNQSFSAQSTVMLQYGYEYRYDSRHNCIYKRLPGCDPVYYVYDKAGRCILSQDGVQRTSGVWTFMLPDVYGRTGLTGTCTNSITYTNEPLKNTVVKAYRSNPSSSIYGYAVTGFSPNLQMVCTVNYYDDYTFIGSGLAPTTLSYATPPTGDYGTQELSTPRGLLTGTAVGRLNSSGTTGYNYSAIYYDGKGRVIQTRGTNHMSGTEYEYIGYNYAGNVLKRQHVHTASGMTTQTETYTYEYNTSGLLANTKHKLNTNSEVTLHQYTYNDIGLLTGKTNGGISSAAETYTYNVRSWLKTISSTLFSETLYYNDNYGGSTAQYGGNVSAMTWNADSKTRGYKFNYDEFSRLTKAYYMENGSTSTHYRTEYSYDRMGNFLTLKRYGKQNSTTYSQIDILSFTYSGNQVTRIDDSGYTPTYTGAFNFVNGASQSGEYTYDQNGNMTKDLNKNISSISYNLLNLPTNISYSSGKSAAYIYDATGKKLRTSYKASASATAVPTDYCGNMIYENNVLKQALIDGGYITFSGTAPYYHFYLQDHLGNNRVVVSPAGTAEQINHYYPFGGLFGESTGNAVQRFRYNGKELDRTHGIDWYDYGARHMTPDAGRFTTVDPMAEKYYNISPYAYCANNPVKNIDVHGDSTRVYTESNGLGHTWMSVGEGNDMIVYSYGRYNGTEKGQKGKSSGTNLSNGDGVLLRLTGENAKEYMADKNEGGMSTFVITDISDSDIQKNIDDIFYSSTKIPDNPKGKYFNNSSARVIDNYVLWNNNCTTFVSDILNNTGSSALMGMTLYINPYGISTTFMEKQRFINPRAMQSFLIQQSNHHNNVYKSK